MSALTQLLRSAAGARRGYSVFSKPGGGRYFLSAGKPHKVAPPSSSNKVESSATPANDAGTSSMKDDEPSAPTNTPAKPEGSAAYLSPSPTFTLTSPVHPRVSPQDLNLHQFFSLHRPLLLLPQSTATLFEPQSTLQTHAPTVPQPARYGNPLESAEASPEADADAARQLARAMVINRLGASIAWEDTLSRLGIDVTEGRSEEVSLAEEEFQVYMDSTKRKRRKKMKKHKLKKRRRATRAQRVKIGR